VTHRGIETDLTVWERFVFLSEKGERAGRFERMKRRNFLGNPWGGVAELLLILFPVNSL
jgi:hypothetical protein